MRLVEGKHGERIGLFEYCGMITSVEFNLWKAATALCAKQMRSTIVFMGAFHLLMCSFHSIMRSFHLVMCSFHLLCALLI